ncbi:hypothetical protein K7432_005070 [Basidiobolus ranarum]|uniref:DUF2330 domain-containing protein n=1 Tax=Basidiobolus ranarum TaxID=34480 RepID=A0ABR2WX62_9FUNG
MLTCKLKHIFLAVISLLLFINVSAFSLEEYFTNQDVNVQVQSLSVSPQTKILAVTIEQVDLIIDEFGELADRTRLLALNLKVDQKQLIDEGPIFYRDIPVYAIDINDEVDLFEAELRNETPKLLPVKMYAWADVEYNEEQDIFFPRVVLQTQILEDNAVEAEVVQVIVDLLDNDQISLFPPQKLPLNQVYYLPAGNQPWTPFSELDSDHSVKAPHHKCGKHMSKIHHQVKSYVENAAESIKAWFYQAAETINTWANEHVDELQLFALIWMSMLGFVTSTPRPRSY